MVLLVTAKLTPTNHNRYDWWAFVLVDQSNMPRLQVWVEAYCINCYSEKFKLLRAVKMWFSSTRSHMSQQRRTAGRFFHLLRHTKRPLPWIITGIIPWKGSCVDRKQMIFPKNMAPPSETETPGTFSGKRRMFRGGLSAKQLLGGVISVLVFSSGGRNRSAQ